MEQDFTVLQALQQTLRRIIRDSQVDQSTVLDLIHFAMEEIPMERPDLSAAVAHISLVKAKLKALNGQLKDSLYETYVGITMYLYEKDALGVKKDH